MNLLLLSLLSGCVGIQVGGSGCEADSITQLSDWTITPEGWEQTVQDVYDAFDAASDSEGTLTHAGHDYDLTQTLTLSGEAWLYSFPGAATTENGCRDQVEFPARLQVQSEVFSLDVEDSVWWWEGMLRGRATVEEDGVELDEPGGGTSADELLWTVELDGASWEGEASWVDSRLGGEQPVDALSWTCAPPE